MRLQKDLYNSQAGLGGERELDYYLREFQPPYPYAVLHDVYLHHQHIYFQIDTLLITPGRLILCEVKNLAGKIHITSNPTQFIKEEPDGTRMVLKSPIEELIRKKYLFSCWLAERKAKAPLMDYVVFAYQNELVMEDAQSHRIAFSYELPNRLRELPDTEELLSSRTVCRLADEIRAAHRVYDPFPLAKKYGVTANEIVTGVWCDECRTLTMQRQAKSWQCRSCSRRDKTAHLTALLDWFCIHGSVITNEQARRLFQVNDRYVVKNLLKHPFVAASGNGRGAVHTISPDILDVYQPVKR